jgi:hypothetical protein
MSFVRGALIGHDIASRKFWAKESTCHFNHDFFAPRIASVKSKIFEISKKSETKNILKPL